MSGIVDIISCMTTQSTTPTQWGGSVSQQRPVQQSSAANITQGAATRRWKVSKVGLVGIIGLIGSRSSTCASLGPRSLSYSRARCTAPPLFPSAVPALTFSNRLRYTLSWNNLKANHVIFQLNGVIRKQASRMVAFVSAIWTLDWDSWRDPVNQLLGGQV